MATSAAADVGPMPNDVVKGPYVVEVSERSATIRYETRFAGPSEIQVVLDGQSTEAGVKSVSAGNVSSAFHSVTLSDLTPDARYTVAISAPGRAGRGGRGAPASRATAQFRTAPTDTRVFTFVAYGDNRTDDVAHKGVANAIEKEPGDFLVHTGDFVEMGSNLEEWQKFFDIERGLLGSRGVYSCIGNHELYENGGKEYAHFFGPSGADNQDAPMLHQTARWAHVRFFLLNAMVNWSPGRDRSWLEQELAKSDSEPGIRFRVIVMHHGLSSSGPHGGNRRMLDAGIDELFRKHKVDLILSGHDHIYERGFAEGLRYVVTGGGGAPTYEIKKRIEGSRRAESAKHFVAVQVTEAGMKLSAKRAEDGSVIETCGFGKGDVAWDCDAPTQVAVVPSPPVPPKKSGCGGCAVHGAPPARMGLELAWPLAIFGGFAMIRQRRRRNLINRGGFVRSS